MNDSNTSTKLLHILITLNTVIFLLLSFLHFYWAFGGTLWYGDVLPTNSTGTKRMQPGVMVSFTVAFSLLSFALITIGNHGIWYKHIKRKYFSYGALLISIIFFIRAIGDFKFIGFFKTVNKTRFALNDTQLFSPICLFIAIVSLWIFIATKHKR